MKLPKGGRVLAAPRWKKGTGAGRRAPGQAGGPRTWAFRPGLRAEERVTCRSEPRTGLAGITATAWRFPASLASFLCCFLSFSLKNAGLFLCGSGGRVRRGGEAFRALHGQLLGSLRAPLLPAPRAQKFSPSPDLSFNCGWVSFLSFFLSRSFQEYSIMIQGFFFFADCIPLWVITRH